jgi:hypothetical protein
MDSGDLADLTAFTDQVIYQFASSRRKDRNRLHIRIGARVQPSLHSSQMFSSGDSSAMNLKFRGESV